MRCLPSRFYFFAVLIAAVLSSTPRVKRLQTKVITKLRFWRFKIKNEPLPTINNLVDKSSTVYGYLAGSFFIALMLIIVAVLSSKSGKEQAQKDIEAFKDKKGNWVKLCTPLLSTPTRAKQVICSTSHCAFWLGTESLILRYESIERIVAYSSMRSAP